MEGVCGGVCGGVCMCVCVCVCVCRCECAVMATPNRHDKEREEKKTPVSRIPGDETRTQTKNCTILSPDHPCKRRQGGGKGRTRCARDGGELLQSAITQVATDSGVSQVQQSERGERTALQSARRTTYYVLRTTYYVLRTRSESEARAKRVRSEGV